MTPLSSWSELLIASSEALADWEVCIMSPEMRLEMRV